MKTPFFEIKHGNSPIVAAAIHNGHQISPYIEDIIALNDKERLREEDPYTSGWTSITDTAIVGNYSRFEVDLNRRKDKAVYQKPEDAWGLQVWKRPLPSDISEKGYTNYDKFYAEVKTALDKVFHKHQFFIVYDLHTYNYMRQGPDATPADPAENPEVNIGTGNLDRRVWGPVVDTLMKELRKFDFNGRHLDVRENVKFKGGYFSEWIFNEYANAACPIAIEFKKFFMNEWDGEADREQLKLIKEALEATVPAVMEAYGMVHENIFGSHG